jgi:hypothetical protein
MAQRDPERYTGGDDGLIAEKVGSWAVDKLKIVTDYVYASGGARKKYAGAGAAYIDPFCGPGRSLIRDTTRFIDGSPIAAFKRALESPGRFTSINISDGDDDLMDAATKRLIAVDAPVCRFCGDCVCGSADMSNIPTMRYAAQAPDWIRSLRPVKGMSGDPLARTGRYQIKARSLRCTPRQRSYRAARS